MSDWKYLNVEFEGNTAVLTISREKVLNALNQDLLNELEEAVASVEQSEDVRALVITGAGEKAFVAGADIKELREISRPDQAEAKAKRGQALFNRIEELNIPVIMAVNGFALGGGLELALSGDIILASENAKFGQPEVNLGVIPGYGGTQRLARLIGKQAAKYLCMTGEMISAEEARRLGIVYQVFPSDQLLPKAKELAQLLAKKAPLAVRFVKKAINQGAEADLRSGLQMEAAYFGLSFATEDRVEGMDAFLEKREPLFKGK